MQTKEQTSELGVVVLDIRDWEIVKVALYELATNPGSGSVALRCRQVLDSIREQVKAQRL